MRCLWNVLAFFQVPCSSYMCICICPSVLGEWSQSWRISKARFRWWWGESSVDSRRAPHCSRTKQERWWSLLCMCCYVTAKAKASAQLRTLKDKERVPLLRLSSPMIYFQCQTSKGQNLRLQTYGRPSIKHLKASTVFYCSRPRPSARRY